MKIYFLLPVINLLVVSNYRHIQGSSTSQEDTTSIIHSLDGNITEWPQEKFMIDNSTKIRYAVDNDSQTLFLVLNISDKRAQQIIMQQGMSMFIDIKGKKKENHGVEFPLGIDDVSNIGNMKVFGFTSGEPVPQNIRTEGTINIAMAWNSSNVLSIEYNIPLKILEGSVNELNNKKISIGWKLQENQMPTNNTAQSSSASSQPVSATSRLVAVPAGSAPPGNRNIGSGRNSTPSQSQTNTAKQPQSIWTTHTIII